jgi:hypothetical protein
VYRFPQPTFLPCPECGAALRHEELDDHVCEEERRLDHQLALLRHGIASFEHDLDAYLSSPRGAFEVWCAERDRLRDAV